MRRRENKKRQGLMEKDNQKGGEDLPPEINQVKEQIEKERFLHINETFELRCKPSVAVHASYHQSLALDRSCVEDNYRRDNNMLLSRMQRPLRHFSCSSYTPKEEEEYDLNETLPSVEFPFVEQLPRSITWVFTNKSLLMAESDSVIGKRQIYYVEGEAVELLKEEDEEDEEETEREKYEFTEDVDRFIWKIGQEYGLEDLVVQSALTNFLKVDVSDILERYNELKLKNDGNVGEASDLRSKSIIITFQEAANNRFCRRCMIFDCHMHDELQPETKSSEEESIFSENEDDKKQCSEHCYLKVRSMTEADHVVDYDSISNQKGENVVSDTYTEAEDCAMDDTEMAMWTPVEKDLYLKGVKIFGRNSCLITKNVFAEHKTCLEVYNYMREQDQRTTMLLEHNKTTGTTNQVNKKVPRRSTKLARKKIRLRKYARYPPALKKTANGEDKDYKLYTPCTCESICGNQCPCLTNKNCCEKYCGCSKKCNNRFRGCNCAKGQCANRQCPCFASNRECDPDLCRRCRLSCGDGAFGETSEQSQCKNMHFLLTKHKKILLARSDVQGWGAFTRDSLKKNEFLGEYTGELITHGEADERGRVEDLLGSSYLFNLNDQLEIDARRKGNKFRFLNHSSEKPNCCAKLMTVRGEQRIGIYSARAINEGEELFFNYGYESEQPAWSRGRNPTKTRGSKNAKDVSPSKLDLDKSHTSCQF